MANYTTQHRNDQRQKKINYKVQKSHLPSVTRFGHGNQISIYQNFLDVKFFTSFFVLIFTSQRKQEEAAIREKEAVETNNQLNSEVQKLKEESATKISALEQQLADKELLNRALIASESDLKAKVVEMSDKQSKLDEISEKLAEMTAERDRQIVEREKDKFNAEKTLNQQLQDLKKAHQKEIDDYQSKFLDLFVRKGAINTTDSKENPDFKPE